MNSGTRIVAGLLLLAGLGLAVIGVSIISHGLSARSSPTAGEVFIARRLRRLAIPSGAGQAMNPVAPSDVVLVEAREHFANHCAICHSNDGSGQTEMGVGLYPRVPDLRKPATQNLTDGEIFYIIENGIRFSGMPAFGTGKPDPDGDKQAWELVRFIRHLPGITPIEINRMKPLNPP